MKKLIVLFALTFSIVSQNINAQCCPYLDNAELMPTPATTSDSIFLITKVATPNLGEFLGYEITETDSLTIVEGCYFSGLLTAIQTYEDTLNLGIRPNGTFKVKFIAHQSSNDSICNFMDSKEVEVSVNIEGSNSTKELEDNSIEVFPNPFNDRVVITSDEQIKNLMLYNQLGVLILEKNNISNNRIELSLEHLPHGIYYLQGSSKEGKVFLEKLVKT